MTAATDLWIAVGYIMAGAWWLHRKLWMASDPLSLLNEDNVWRIL